MKPPRLVLLAVTGASLLAFTGCAPVGDVAIEAGGTKLSTKDVDLFTTFLCGYRAESAVDPSTGQAAPGSTVPVQQARGEAAKLLAESLISQRAADAAQVSEDLPGLEQALTQLEPVIAAAASGKDRERLKELLVDSIASSSRIESAVKNEMVAELGEAINQLPQEEGQAIFDQKYAAMIASGLAGADLEIDPVYGVDEKSLVGGQDASLSRPVSTFAQDATQAQSAPAWLDGLPQNQRCGG